MIIIKKKYKILIVENNKNDKLDNFQNINHFMKVINIKNLKNELKNECYDFIYLYKLEINEQIKEIIKNYTELPKMLKKIKINYNQDLKVYVNEEFINELIFKNIKIIEFNNNMEENTIATVISKIIKKDYELIDIKKAIKEISLNVEINIKPIIKKVVRLNYTQNNLYRKIKYILKYDFIEHQFFEKIINNIKNDINAISNV